MQNPHGKISQQNLKPGAFQFCQGSPLQQEIINKEKVRALSSNYLGQKPSHPPQSSQSLNRRTYRKITQRKSGGDDFNVSKNKNLQQALL